MTLIISMPVIGKTHMDELAYSLMDQNATQHSVQQITPCGAASQRQHAA
jgi:hypothetical protein